VSMVRVGYMRMHVAQRFVNMLMKRKQRAVGPLRHSSPRSAKLITSLPATIR